MNQSTPTVARGKPEKPYDGFPLFAHPSGQWAKKIRKRLIYFGSWRTDPEGTQALETLNREWPYLSEGRPPPAVDVSDGCTLRLLCNDFLSSKKGKMEAGDLSPRTFRDYYRTCEGVLEHFGKERLVSDLRPDDFRGFRAKLAKRFGVVSLKNEVNRVCILFNYAHENALIEKPVTYGQQFDKPSARALRRSRNEAGTRLFEREEVLALLGASDPILRAAILLGVNGGLGNSDVACLPQSAIDFKSGWLDYPRVKTEIPRRIPLWPETLEALKSALVVRPKPADPADNGLCFLTRQGRPWVRIRTKIAADGTESFLPLDALGQSFGKLLRKLKINGRRGLGLYSLRHTFETRAGESKDQVAVDSIMGHVDSSMAANYRHGISDERLRAVVEVVRRWVFGTEGGA